MITDNEQLTTAPRELLVATFNRGKVREMQEFLENLPVRLKSLHDFSRIEEVEETGATFAENAGLKASAYARQTGIWSLSDDSGLEVEALGGAPGVLSARYGGSGASDRDRIDKLLAELKETGDRSRKARFVCSMAVADEKGEIRFLAEGICRGTIAARPRGLNGFGYDPIFMPDGFQETFGELSSATKREISHRALAISKIIAFLRDFTALELDQSDFRL